MEGLTQIRLMKKKSDPLFSQKRNERKETQGALPNLA